MRSSTRTTGRNTEENLLAWLNFVLSRRHLHAASFDDLRDGVLLAHLVSLLGRKPHTGRIKDKRPLKKFDALGNLTLVFDFLAREHVRLFNVGPEDVWGGNVKLMSGLLWTLIQRYVIAEQADDGEGALDELTGARSPKQRLLEWCKVVVNSYPGVKVESFAKGFEDGLALAALVHFHQPGELDFYSLPRDAGSGLNNLRAVFAVLHSRWGIPMLCSAEDVANGRADEDLMVTLIATCRNELKNKPQGGERPGVLIMVGPSRALLARVMESALAGSRADTDAALAQVASRFRELLQEALDSSLASSAPVRECHDGIDRALKDLLVDAVRLCNQPQSHLLMRLTRRDCTVLAAVEHDLMQLLTSGSKRTAIQQMQAIKAEREPERILQQTRLLEEEISRVASAAKARAQAVGSEHHQLAANDLAAQLAAMPIGPLATQGASAELDQSLTEILRIMADLELTLNVQASELFARLDEAFGSASDEALAALCQSAIATTRTATREYPKPHRAPVLEALDKFDQALTQFCDAVSRVQLHESASAVHQLVLDAEASLRVESAVPELRSAVVDLLMAVRKGNRGGIRDSSSLIDAGSKRAIELAEAQKTVCADPVLVDRYIADLVLLRPLHRQHVDRALALQPDQMQGVLLQRVAECSRDLLAVVTDLDQAARTVEDEFSSLQALALDLSLDDFELVQETRELAHTARHVAPDQDTAALIAELEQCVLRDDRNGVAASVPALQKRVVASGKENAARRRDEDPDDDLLRMGRYARAGVENQRIVELRDGVKRKVRRKLAKADPIKHQRVMQATEALLPALESPGAMLGELEALTFCMEDADALLFPDLVLASPIDLDACILALQDEQRSDDALPVRLVDQHTLKLAQPLSMEALEPLQPPPPAAAVDALLLGELEQLQLQPLSPPPSAKQQQTQRQQISVVNSLARLRECEATLASHAPPQQPQLPSHGALVASVQQRVGQLAHQCQRADMHYDDFSDALLATAQVVRDNVALVQDDALRAQLVRLVTTMVQTGVRALSVMANDDDESRTRLRENANSVPLVANRVVALLAQAASSAAHSAGPPPAASGVNVLAVGKALTTAIAELSKGQLASFDGRHRPVGFAGSLQALADNVPRIHGLVLKGASIELQEVVVFHVNCLKHLASGFARGNEKLLDGLVQRAKKWAGALLLALKQFEDTGLCRADAQGEALLALNKFTSERVVQRCAKCKEPLANNITTSGEGVSYHTACFED